MDSVYKPPLSIREETGLDFMEVMFTCGGRVFLERCSDGMYVPFHFPRTEFLFRGPH